MEVDEIGERIAQSVLNYFAQPEHRQLIERLKAAGLQFETAGENAPVSDKLNGLSIVISGTFVHHSRDEYKTLIEQHGGKNIDPRRQPQIVFWQVKWTRQALKKHKKLGVKIFDENEFLE